MAMSDVNCSVLLKICQSFPMSKDLLGEAAGNQLCFGGPHREQLNLLAEIIHNDKKDWFNLGLFWEWADKVSIQHMAWLHHPPWLFFTDKAQFTSFPNILYLWPIYNVSIPFLIDALAISTFLISSQLMDTFHFSPCTW